MEDKKEGIMDLAELKKSMVGKAVIKVNFLNDQKIFLLIILLIDSSLKK